MRATPLLVTALCLTVSTFALAGVSFADKGPKAKKVKTEVRATLASCCGDPEPDSSGKAKRKAEARNEVVEKDEFEGKIKVPVPSTGLGIANEATAASADIRLVLSHGGTPYAECLFEFDELETEEEDGEIQTEAEYKVNVRLQLKKGTPILQARKGTCDTDLGTAGIQTGVPNVREDDTTTAILVVNPDDRTKDIPFLEGTFTKKK